MPNLISRLTATIANGASLSDALTLAGRQVAVIEMPSSWTAACLTFQASLDGSNYFNVYHDDGSEVYVIVDASRRVHVDIEALSQQKYIKLRSGTSITAVNQGAGRTIYVEVWT
ncbi:MAG: hypothetical protein A2Z04_01560 [Chloroflexi bacterium RBG_16_57_9]|nr:MAG: hypothetical protein A2Z04_01560 [Chloroflexi bacterium RBG_16_57_9]